MNRNEQTQQEYMEQEQVQYESVEHNEIQDEQVKLATYDAIQKEPSAWDHFYGAIRYKYATFSGRASRAELLSFYLFNYVFSMGINVVLSGFIRDDATIAVYVYMFLVVLYNLFMFLPSLSITVRRLHDSNKSGWYLLLPYALILLPILYGISYAITQNLDYTVGILSVFVKFLAFVGSFFGSIFGGFGDYPEHAWAMGLFIVIYITIHIYLWYLLLRKTQPDDNRYGPSLLNPKE
ncbi:DUF805 domain-containing protein [Veillonella agrestimuris]|uniref:DUF805 domain-containing protein n=1 Tax=Veillonella agrestimuris TaxID=2941340 RepID=UPI00203BB84E|nr:DUF805 domain-containing protein [Veillonella agrestimuris]